MSQHDQVIADQEGSPFLAELNQALAAIFSNDSGGTAPATTVAYQWWADTASGLLKQRNAANNGWVDVALMSSFALPSVQKQLATAFTTTGTSTAYLLTPAPAIAANTAGLRFRVAFHTPPSGTPTLAVSGQTALPLKFKDDGGVKQAITSTQVPANWSADVETDGTDWVVLNIAPVNPSGSGSGFDADKLDGQHGQYYLDASVPRDCGTDNVGSICLVQRSIAINYAPGATIAGSLITPTGIYFDGAGGAGRDISRAGLSGTWRMLGSLYAPSGSNAVGLAQRIA